MTTGWKSAHDARRPHTRSRLKKRPPSSNISKKRRRSVKDQNSAMKRKGLLPT